MTFRVVGLLLAATALGACGPSNAVPGCKDPAYERPSGFFELEATVFRGEADWSVFNERCKERLLPLRYVAGAEDEIAELERRSRKFDYHGWSAFKARLLIEKIEIERKPVWIIRGVV